MHYFPVIAAHLFLLLVKNIDIDFLDMAELLHKLHLQVGIVEVNESKA